MLNPNPFPEHLRVERELGRGGMATVYLAHDLRHDRLVALKVLHPELGTALGPERFKREIELTSRLDHPGVLPVLESGASADGFWYTMPYVEGGSLRARLQQQSQLSIAEAVRIAGAVALLLDHAHRHGVVHRDIKPENILLSGRRILVADFGIAKLLAAENAAKLTETGLSLGTPAYMSPEQAAGDSRLGGRADIYALGCVLYEMLAGQPPFTGPTAQAILARHAVDPMPSLRTVRSTVAPALEAAIRRAMAKVPADRFDNGAEFAAALDACLAGAPGALETVAEPRRTAVGTGRRWARDAVAAGLVAGAIGWAFFRAHGPSVAPSASVMAVLPFAPAGADTALARLGRDLAGTVSASLDGVGEIRMVDRLTILAQTEDRKSALPLADAAALGRRYGATSVVTGSLARDGGKVRLDVGLYSTDSLRPLARAIVTGSPDSLSALTDSVTWRVLAEVWWRGKPPTPTLEAVTTHSVEALRAYLDGEEASVAGRNKEARAAYDRAVAIDSTFWYAYFRAASAAGWYEGDVDSVTTQAFFGHRNLLPRRERLLIEASVLDSGLVWRRAHLRSLVEEYPDYWPAWFMLGDNLVHWFPYIGSPRAEARHALERVVALNPRMVYGWGHLVWMYQADRDTAAAARALDALDRLGARARFIENEGVDRMLLWRTIQALQEGSSDSVRLLDSLYRFAIDTSTTDAFALAIELGVASPAAQIRFTQRVLRHGVSAERADAFRSFVPMMWAARGAWDSALALLDETADTDSLNPRGLQSYGLCVLGTWLGEIPPGEARTRRPAAAKAAAAASTRLARYLNAELAWLDGIEAMSRGDTAALVSAAVAVHAAGDTLGDSLRNRIVDLSPYVLALRGDRITAARRLAELEWKTADQDPNMRTGIHPLRRVIGRTAAADWLLQAGDTAQASQLLLYGEAYIGPFWEKIAVRPLLAFRQAQIEEARGQRALATRDYTNFLIGHDMPAPSHQRLLEEARSALGRLARSSEASVDR